MIINERVAALAAYYMARFNSNLGHTSQIEAFQKIEDITGIDCDRVRASMRDVFDYWFPHRNGWDKADKKKIWKDGLRDIFLDGNELSSIELKNMLIMLKIWA
jgi:hypothetical protein